MEQRPQNIQKVYLSLKLRGVNVVHLEGGNTEYLEPSDMERVSFPNLKPTSRSISIRIPEYLLNRVKEKANEINIPYQSLIKEYIRRGALSQK